MDYFEEDDFDLYQEMKLFDVFRLHEELESYDELRIIQSIKRLHCIGDVSYVR